MKFTLAFVTKLDSLFDLIFGGCPGAERTSTTHEKATFVKGKYTHSFDPEYAEDGRLISMEIESELTNKVGTVKTPNRQDRINYLEGLKKEALEKEEYRQAADIVEEINGLKELEVMHQTNTCPESTTRPAYDTKGFTSDPISSGIRWGGGGIRQ